MSINKSEIACSENRSSTCNLQVRVLLIFFKKYGLDNGVNGDAAGQHLPLRIVYQKIGCAARTAEVVVTAERKLLPGHLAPGPACLCLSRLEWPGWR